MSAGTNAVTVLTEWLLERHRQIKTLERDGLAALCPENDLTYRKKMREKAELLATLAKDASPMLEGLPQPAKMFARDELFRFSANAREAIQLNSIFYMAQLLYPENYQEGNADNLELFIEELKDFSS